MAAEHIKTKKKSEIKTTHDIVLKILVENENARSSDNILYYLVCKEVGSRRGVNIAQVSFEQFFTTALAEYGLPTFETVRRTRQKIQAECPELAGNRAVRYARMACEGAFVEYARN